MRDTNGQTFIQAYHSLFEITDKAKIDSDNSIAREDWPLGYALIGVQIYPRFGAEEYTNLEQQGSLRLEISFVKTLPKSITVVLYSETNDFFQIDQTRSIITST